MPRITELYAWVVADSGPEDEGVPAFTGLDGRHYPMMGADLARATSLRKEAKTVARALGKPVRLIRSTGIEEVEVVEP